MKISRRFAVRTLLAAVALLVVCGIAAPFIGADRYGRQIRAAMERGLNRKVEIGTVKFNLFTGPGFTIKDVIIYDDPAAGAEPFAHMPELEARVRMSALLAGRIEFSRLRFVEPSVNIVKPDAGSWNIVPLLQRTVTVNAGTDVARLPEIQFSDGRIMFKFGKTKSTFYFLDADVTIAPRSSEKGAFLLRFSGAPARTDRAAQGFGEFTAAGRLLTGGGESRLEVDVELEKGDIADLVALIRGQSVGLHGMITSTAKIYGPVSNLQILGNLHVDDVHRWDVMPVRTDGLDVKYRGSFNAGSQRLEVAAARKDNPTLPLSAQLIVDGALSEARWSADLTIDGMQASALIGAARHMGAPIPGELTVTGKVVGLVGYGPADGLQGQLWIDGANVKLGDGPELSVERAALLVAGEELHLPPATVASEGRSAELEAVFSPTRQRFDAIIRGRGLPMASLASGYLIATRATPLLQRFSGGTWSGWIRYASDSENKGSWSAKLDVRDTVTRVPGLAAPVKIAAAAIELDGSDVTMRRMRVSAGKLELSGDYGYAKTGDRHVFHLTLPSASAQEVEHLLTPTLRRTNGLLARMRLTQSNLPEWLRQRRAEGTIHIGKLSLGEVDVRGFRTRVRWSGTDVQLSDIQGRFEEGILAGDATLDLSRMEPQYLLNGQLTDVAWRSGKVDLSGTLTTAGTGADLLLNLRSEGTFQARTIDLLPEYPLRTLSGTYGIALTRSGPQIKLTALQAAVGTERFSGEGRTQPDGRLQLEFASANRVMHVSGPVTPLRLEVSSEPAVAHTR